MKLNIPIQYGLYPLTHQVEWLKQNLTAATRIDKDADDWNSFIAGENVK